MDNLTPQLNDQDIRENIDALFKAGKSQNEVQSYVDNYQKDPSGNYILKSQQKPEEIKPQAPSVGEFAGREFIEAGKKVKESISKGAEKYEKAVEEKRPFKATGELLKAGLGTVSGAVQGIFAPFTALLERSKAKAEEQAKEAGLEAPKSIFETFAETGAGQKLAEWTQKHPEAATTLSDTLNVVLAGLGGEVVPLEKGALETTAKDIFGKVKGAPSAVKETLGLTPEAKLAKETAKIQETIAPKPTIGVGKKAMEEARLVRGKKTLLFGKEPDKIIPSAKQMEAVNVINKQIPNASKMSDAELYTAMNKKIGELSENLKPEMEKTPVSDTTKQTTFDSWTEVKKNQTTQPDFLDNERGNLSFQNQFERRIEQIKSSKNMKNVWDIAIEYDKSIPKNIKNATDQSPPQNWFRKQMWLENRSVLRDVINDVSTGMGETSKQPFSDMHHMYSAQESILTKAKPDVVGKEGILPTTKTGVAKMVGGTIITGLGLDYLAHKLGIF